ncbi:MAG: helix-turn-helix domain-containing protein [Anaeromyxobacteraceae bacterium]
MMERGERKPTLDILDALARALGVPRLDLFQGRRARR